MLGARIRELRTARGMTVAGLATKAGVSTGLISQVERDLADPSLETLRRIARTLDVPLFNLFQNDEAAAVSVIRADHRMVVHSPHNAITYSRISPTHGRLEMLEGQLQPGGSSSPDPWSHPSEECVLVTQGQLTVEISGRENVLNGGDSCYFDSNLPHRYLNHTEETVTFIVSITPPSY